MARQRIRGVEGTEGSFKTEMEIAEYDREGAARSAVAEYIDYYRFDRKHSSLGYLTPVQFANRVIDPK